MARPPNADAAATRARILEVATRLFAKRGAEGAKLREIAREASLSIGLVGHYFGGKRELYDACVEALYSRLDSLRGALEMVVGRISPSAELVQEAARLAFRFGRAQREAAMLITREIIDRGGELDPKRRDDMLLPFLKTLAPRLSRDLDLPEAEVRLRLQTMIFLADRYAIMADRELALVAGTGSDPGAEKVAIELAEEHYVRVALALFPFPPA